mmetsp:Transcript_21852/g.65500  ORF Transcript_21852/g.65500 Transcript_21852/m.65500 type:complete len:98 (+) Transcript_21852:707-1000(+)
MDFLSKFRAKAEKDPLVPVGCGATLACLLAGLYTFHTGQAALSQKMMRARVVAQAATVVVLGVGTYAASLTKDTTNERPKGMHPIEFEALQREQGKR